MPHDDDLRKKAQEKIPGQRVHFHYRAQSGPHQGEAVELPLKMLALGNFKGYREAIPLAERESVNLTPENFNDTMQAADSAISLAKHPAYTLKIQSLDDFHPDRIAAQLPDLRHYLYIRELLNELKSSRASKKKKTVVQKALRRALRELMAIESALFDHTPTPATAAQ